jgi:hypothetical protein
VLLFGVGYALVTEMFSEASPTKIFQDCVDRVRDDPEVRFLFLSSISPCLALLTSSLAYSSPPCSSPLSYSTAPPPVLDPATAASPIPTPLTRKPVSKPSSSVSGSKRETLTQQRKSRGWTGRSGGLDRRFSRTRTIRGRTSRGWIRRLRRRKRGCWRRRGKLGRTRRGGRAGEAGSRAGFRTRRAMLSVGCLEGRKASGGREGRARRRRGCSSGRGSRSWESMRLEKLWPSWRRCVDDSFPFFLFVSSVVISRVSRILTNRVAQQDPQTGHFVYKQLFIAIPGSFPSPFLSLPTSNPLPSLPLLLFPPLFSMLTFFLPLRHPHPLLLPPQHLHRQHYSLRRTRVGPLQVLAQEGRRGGLVVERGGITYAHLASGCEKRDEGRESVSGAFRAARGEEKATFDCSLSSAPGVMAGEYGEEKKLAPLERTPLSTVPSTTTPFSPRATLRALPAPIARVRPTPARHQRPRRKSRVPREHRPPCEAGKRRDPPS